jgi:ATP synthase in type III secretion protein N
MTSRGLPETETPSAQSGAASIDFGKLRVNLRATRTVKVSGRVVRACGTMLQVRGLSLHIGELCRLCDEDSDRELLAEVVGLEDQDALLMPLGSLQGVSPRMRVEPCGTTQSIRVDESMIGRVLDASGQALDGGAPLVCRTEMPLMAAPPHPLQRAPVTRTFETGVRAIDTLLTVGEGQRLGIFATAGGGKSTLLGMLARRSCADVNVIALVGERGREIQEFIADSLQGDLSRSILVVSTSDTPALSRARAVYTATAIAEYFRDQGKRVLLLVDSVTRYARALRDVGLTAGEPPTRRGFPPSVFSTLPQALERAGNSSKGSITAFYTVLVEDEDSADPVGEEVRSILDGHLILSRELAAANHYPAIDVLHSVSRVMDRIVAPEHRQAAAFARSLLAKHRDLEVLLQMGEYKPGTDQLADVAVACAPQIKQHLRQAVEESSSSTQSLASLVRAMTPRAG